MLVLMCVNNKIKTILYIILRFKFNYDALNKHCLEYNIKLNNDYSKDNLTQKSIISGICSNDKCNNIFLSNLRLLFRHNFTCSDCIKIKLV